MRQHHAHLHMVVEWKWLACDMWRVLAVLAGCMINWHLCTPARELKIEYWANIARTAAM